MRLDKVTIIRYRAGMLKCAWSKCGREFEPSKVGGVPVYWQKYCSRECATAARNARARAKVKRALEIAAKVEVQNEE